jgi:hypothetical protein
MDFILEVLIQSLCSLEIPAAVTATIFHSMSARSSMPVQRSLIIKLCVTISTAPNHIIHPLLSASRQGSEPMLRGLEICAKA